MEENGKKTQKSHPLILPKNQPPLGLVAWHQPGDSLKMNANGDRELRTTPCPDLRASGWKGARMWAPWHGVEAQGMRSTVWCCVGCWQEIWLWSQPAWVWPLALPGDLLQRPFPVWAPASSPEKWGSTKSCLWGGLAEWQNVLAMSNTRARWWEECWIWEQRLGERFLVSPSLLLAHAIYLVSVDLSFPICEAGMLTLAPLTCCKVRLPRKCSVNGTTLYKRGLENKEILGIMMNC